MIGKRLWPVGLVFLGVLLGAAFSNLTPHVAAAQSMGPMASGKHMSRADTQMMQAMDTMNVQMRALNLNGNTDRDFMLMMIPHHRAAVAMAQVELRYGKSGQVKNLARSIISDQRKEISQMKTWLAESY